MLKLLCNNNIGEIQVFNIQLITLLFKHLFQIFIVHVLRFETPRPM